MDKEAIIIGGVALGALLLFIPKGSSTNSNTGAVETAVQNMGLQIAAAPATINAVSQLEQTRLAANNAHEQSFYGFVADLNAQAQATAHDASLLASHAMDVGTIRQDQTFMNGQNMYELETARQLVSNVHTENTYKNETDRTATNQAYNLGIEQNKTQSYLGAFMLENERLAAQAAAAVDVYRIHAGALVQQYVAKKQADSSNTQAYVGAAQTAAQTAAMVAMA